MENVLDGLSSNRSVTDRRLSEVKVRAVEPIQTGKNARVPEFLWGDTLTTPLSGPHLMPQGPEAVSAQGHVLPRQVLIHTGTSLQVPRVPVVRDLILACQVEQNGHAAGQGRTCWVGAGTVLEASYRVPP